MPRVRIDSIEVTKLRELLVGNEEALRQLGRAIVIDDGDVEEEDALKSRLDASLLRDLRDVVLKKHDYIFSTGGGGRYVGTYRVGIYVTVECGGRETTIPFVFSCTNHNLDDIHVEVYSYPRRTYWKTATGQNWFRVGVLFYLQSRFRGEDRSPLEFRVKKHEIFPVNKSFYEDREHRDLLFTRFA